MRTEMETIDPSSAYHEAGHAVTAYLFSGTHIRIFRSKNSGAKAYNLFDVFVPWTPQQSGIQFLSGFKSEVIAGFIEEVRFHSLLMGEYLNSFDSGSDFEDFWDLNLPTGQVSEIIQATDTILRDHWIMAEILAESLIGRYKISQSSIEKLLHRGASRNGGLKQLPRICRSQFTRFAMERENSF
jgi:hypothetical protein